MDFHDNWEDMDSHAKKLTKDSFPGGFDVLYNPHINYNILNDEFIYQE